MKQERQLIGYLLVRDLPGIKKGVLYEKIGRDEAYKRRIVLSENTDYTYSYIDHSIRVNSMYVKEIVENTPKWFKPVYK